MEDIQDSFSDYLKCPICFEIPKDKMFQCRNGHRFCEDCCKMVREKVCPQCKDRIPKNPIRCKAVEELLDSFGLEFPCQFKNAGCQLKWDRKDIGDHNSSCKYDVKRFGPLTNVCRVFGFLNCPFTFNQGSIDEALAHFQQEHKMRSITCLLTRQFKICYESFAEIVNCSETKVFTPLIFDQRFWGHNFIYIIVIRFNPYDKTMQFLPFYLTHGPFSLNGSKGFPEEVKFSLESEEASATVRPQLLLNWEGRTLSDLNYFALPISKMGFNAKNSYSSLQINISKDNTPQPPKDVKGVFLVPWTNYTLSHFITPFLLNKPWPPLIRQVNSVFKPQNSNEFGWIAWNGIEDWMERFTSLSTFNGVKGLICRANINEKWHIGEIKLDTENPFNALFKSPFLLKAEEIFNLTTNFEVLYAPSGSLVWAAWKDVKEMQPVLVHEEDKDLLICELRWSPAGHFIGALRKGEEVDGRADIHVLVFSETGKAGQHKCTVCGQAYFDARLLKQNCKQRNK